MKTAVVVAGLALGSARAAAEPPPQVEIVGGKSIGAIVLGMSRRSLPPGIRLTPRNSAREQQGYLDDLAFNIGFGKVNAVWVRDINTSRSRLTYKGNPLPATPVTLEALIDYFGDCRAVDPSEIKYGRVYRCQAGVTISDGVAVGLSVP